MSNLHDQYLALKANIAAYHAQFENPLRFIEIAEKLCNKLWRKYVNDESNKPRNEEEAERWHQARKYIVELESHCEHARHIVNADGIKGMGIMFHAGMLYERLVNVLPKDRYVINSKNAVNCMANARRTPEDSKSDALSQYDALIEQGHMNKTALAKVQRATGIKARTLRSWVDKRKQSP